MKPVSDITSILVPPFSSDNKLLNSMKLIIQPVDDVPCGIQVDTAFEPGSYFAELTAFACLSHLALSRVEVISRFLPS